MARIVILARDDTTAAMAGDVVAVVEDSDELGSRVTLPRFIVFDLPGVSVANAEHLAAFPTA